MIVVVVVVRWIKENCAACGASSRVEQPKLSQAAVDVAQQRRSISHSLSQNAMMTAPCGVEYACLIYFRTRAGGRGSVRMGKYVCVCFLFVGVGVCTRLIFCGAVWGKIHGMDKKDCFAVVSIQDSGPKPKFMTMMLCFLEQEITSQGFRKRCR